MDTHTEDTLNIVAKLLVSMMSFRHYMWSLPGIDIVENSLLNLLYCIVINIIVDVLSTLKLSNETAILEVLISKYISNELRATGKF